MEAYMEDCKALLSDIKKQDKSLRIKRRWLMDLPLYESEQKRMKKHNFLMDKNIPETLLREDDIYYDNIRIFVGRGFGVDNSLKDDHLFQENSQLCDSYGGLCNLLSLLQEMTNYGLRYFADLVTNGAVNYEKTRSKMKKIIKEYLPTFLSQRNNNFEVRREKINNMLKDPKYFRGNHTGICSPAEAFQAGALWVLNRLEELPPQALNVMHRKLKGKTGYIPKLEHKTYSRKRYLIGPIRNRCMKMLSELDGREEPQEPLAKALAVAGLTFKLILGHPCVMEFQKLSPEVEALQNDIAKAIGLVNSEKKVSIVQLEALCKKLHSSQDIKFSRRSVRSIIRNHFIEYLLECSDMDVIPEYLLDALYEINTSRSPSWSCLNKEIEEEMECLLCSSAQIKQIVWDLHPELEVDLEFSDAYMESVEESDDDVEEEVELPKNCQFHSCDSTGLTESMGEISPIASESPVALGKVDGVSSLFSPSSVLNIKVEPMDISERGSIQSHTVSQYLCSPESKMSDSRQYFNGNECQLGTPVRSIWPDLHTFVSPANQNQSEFSLTMLASESEAGHDAKKQQTVDDSTENVELLDSGPRIGQLGTKQCTKRNQYLSIQEACDETTMAMYRIIGSMLDVFARAENLNLTHGDICYLQSHAPNDSKVSEDQKATCQTDMPDSVLIHVLGELMPSFPESGKKKLMKLMCHSSD